MRSQQNGSATSALPLPTAFAPADALPRRALILGANPAGSALARDLTLRSPEPIIAVAFADDDPAKRGTDFGGLPVFDIKNDFSRQVEEWGIQIIFASAGDAMGRHLPIPIYNAADYYERTWSKIPSEFISGAWFESPGDFRLLRNASDDKGKRVFDVIASTLLLLICSPLYLLVALAIKWDSKGPVFYHQMRTGRDGVVFAVHKFRSMRQDAESCGAPQWASENDPRITRIGNILRKTRLDEIPQFWNVLKGEMSLIGPRPERPEFDIKLENEIPHYKARYRVRPGISGWAQVMFTYASSVEDAREKLAFDLYYLKHGSPSLDILIFLRTIQVALLGKGR